jgi:lysylphosphatidylglycerol synthetase-like protein (DUF2156 family)
VSHVAGISTSASFDDRMAYLRQYGTGSLSYSSLQEGLDYFMEPGCGYIAYSLIHGDAETPLCLADPICSLDKMEHLIGSFLRRYKTPIFVHISKATAEILSELGFLINEIGTETIIDIPRFSLTGAPKQFLRSQRNRAMKDGISIKEQHHSAISQDVLEQISREWMSRKVNKTDLSFLVRPVKYEDEVDVRKFFAYSGDRVVGFGFFDPIYSNNKIIGYLDNIHRESANVSYSVPDNIILEAMNQFKTEGKDILSLGFSAFYKVDDTGEFKFSEKLRDIFRYLHENGNYLYDFKGAAFHKSHYRPGVEGCEEVKVYCACQSPIPIHHLDKVLVRIGIHAVDQMVQAGANWIDRMLTVPSVSDR